ncbi:AVN_collapsed_G0046600.mRNA.1.CDS.1 [Saccharomyces cerevisiae]|nr:AVN_collapsed_G0046600.mRNA.1.CDS.1 [Saccharomyces cerevisiae]
MVDEPLIIQKESRRNYGNNNRGGFRQYNNNNNNNMPNIGKRYQHELLNNLKNSKDIFQTSSMGMPIGAMPLPSQGFIVGTLIQSQTIGLPPT